MDIRTWGELCALIMREGNYYDQVLRELACRTMIFEMVLGSMGLGFTPAPPLQVHSFFDMFEFCEPHGRGDGYFEAMCLGLPRCGKEAEEE